MRVPNAQVPRVERSRPQLILQVAVVSRSADEVPLLPASHPATKPEQNDRGKGRERQNREPQDTPVRVAGTKAENDQERDLKEERAKQPKHHVHECFQYGADNAALTFAPSC